MATDFCLFGLIVTGKGEEKFLGTLFRAIMAKAQCRFVVIRRIGQRDPITSPVRLAKLKMTGTRKPLPTKDETEIGLEALGFLRRFPHSAVILIDDLEPERRDIADQVFARYRTAFDSVLETTGLQSRASVHFLVNMLEAYYFAHHEAVNSVAGIQVLADDHPTDVEDINHPKNELRRRWPPFDEVEHGASIVPKLDLNHVLCRPAECCWLRSLFAWCVGKLVSWDAIFDKTLIDAFCLPDGCKAALTYPQ